MEPDSPMNIHSGQKSTSIFKNRVDIWEIKADMVFPITGAEIMWKGLFP